MIITTFSGYSGSRVELVAENNKVFVRKTGNTHRNYSRLTALTSQGYPVCRVLDYKDDIINLEYIHGLDMLNYLQQNDPKNLLAFLVDLISAFAKNHRVQDYSQIYNDKLTDIDFASLPFTKIELLSRLPQFLHASEYHGDLTLENIIYSEKRGFVLIDAVDIEYDSYQFDLAKLAQDVICKWFLRHKRINLDYKLLVIEQGLADKFGKIQPELIISQLLRVYRHTGQDIVTRNFLENKMRSLWK